MLCYIVFIKQQKKNKNENPTEMSNKLILNSANELYYLIY